MLKISLEYIRGILFIDLKGVLTSKETKEIYDYIIPAIKKHNIKEVVFSLDDLNAIDEYGFEALIGVKHTLNRLGGDMFFYNVKEKYTEKMLSLNFKIISSLKLS